MKEAKRQSARGFLMSVYTSPLTARQHKLPSRIRGFGKQQRCFPIPAENSLSGNAAKGESDSQYRKGLHRLRNRFAIHNICQTCS